MRTKEENQCGEAAVAGAGRITLFAGHYGSGKTNIALAYARLLRRGGAEVAVADLDIVNPYFRTKDAAQELEREGIRLVVSDYANSNVDFPALPKETYSLVAGGAAAPRVALAAVVSALFSFAHYIDYAKTVSTRALAFTGWNSAFLALFFFALAQCWIYRRTGALWCALLNHALFNLTNLALLFILPE